MDLPQHLLDSARDRKLIPFIGAGFSKPFNLPSWSQLIEYVSESVDLDPDIANLYGDYLLLAEYLSIEQRGLGKLRSKLDKEFNSASIDISTSPTHMLLPQLKSYKVYTTNWDNLIERSFETQRVDFNKIVSYDDILDAKPNLPDIIKFHGDFSSSEDSLVFTETSYFKRLDFETPLDITLRGDLLGNTLIFLGYSLSDYNIRYMWYRLQKMKQAQSSTRKADPVAYIVMVNKNPVFESICKHSRDIEVIFLDNADVNNSMRELLETLVNQVK